MSDPIKITLDAETAGAEKGLSKTSGAIDDLAGSLDSVSGAADAAGSDIKAALTAAEKRFRELAAAAYSSGSDMEKVYTAAANEVQSQLRAIDKTGSKAFDGIADDAKKSAKIIDRDLTEALDSVKAKSKGVGDELGTSMKRGTDQASEGTRAFKENAAQNIKEAAASFTDVDSALNGIQGLAAEALEGFGPAGIAAGAAAAAGIGVAVTLLTTAAERVNTIKEQAADLAKSAVTSDSSDRLAAMQSALDDVLYKIRDARSWWELWQDSAVTGAEQIAEAADTGSQAIGDFVDAFDTADARQQLTKLDRAMGTSKSRVSDLQEQMSRAENEANVGWYQDRIDAEKALQAIMQDSIDTAREQVSIEDAAATARGLTVEQYRTQAVQAQAAADAQASFSESLASAAGPVDSYNAILQTKQDADRAAAEATAASTEDASDSWETYATDVTVTMQNLIDDLNEKVKAKAEFEANCAAIAAAGGQAIADELLAQGPVVAGAQAALIASATPAEQRSYFIAWSKETGKQAATGMASSIRESGPQILSATQAAVNEANAGLTVPQVMFNAVVGGLQDAVNAAARRVTPPQIRFDATVYARPGVPQAG